MANRKNDNGNGNGSDEVTPPTPGRSRRITADDLSKAAEAAREAAAAASTAAEAVVVALESGEVEDTVIQDVEDQGRGGQRSGGQVAFEEFMAQLEGVIRKAGDNVDVTEHSRWVKIESMKNGHKIYIAKGKNQVSRIESTLPPNLVPGAVEPDRKNGRIASYLPPDPKAVSVAIRQLVQSQEQIRAPQRGGAAGGGQQTQGGGGGSAQRGRGGGGQGGGRPQGEFN